MSSTAALNLIATAMANNTAALEGIAAQNSTTLSESASASTPSMFLKRKTEKDYVSEMAAALQRVAGGNLTFKGDGTQTLKELQAWIDRAGVNENGRFEFWAVPVSEAMSPW